MPKKVDHQSRRDAFLAAAHRTVSKKGVGAATMREVAKEAGFTTGALVHYVESVETLLVEASEIVSQGVGKDLTAIEHLPNRLEALRQVLYLTLPTDTERKGNWNFLIGLWERSFTDPVVRKRMQERVSKWHARTERMIRAAQKAGDIPPDVDVLMATRAIATMIDGLAVQVMRTGKPMPAAEQYALIDMWIVNWLKPRNKPPAKGSVAGEAGPPQTAAAKSRR